MTASIMHMLEKSMENGEPSARMLKWVGENAGMRFDTSGIVPGGFEVRVVGWREEGNRASFFIIHAPTGKTYKVFGRGDDPTVPTPDAFRERNAEHYSGMRDRNGARRAILADGDLMLDLEVKLIEFANTKAAADRARTELDSALHNNINDDQVLAELRKEIGL
jgi:hypothetical protein